MSRWSGPATSALVPTRDRINGQHHVPVLMPFDGAALERTVVGGEEGHVRVGVVAQPHRGSRGGVEA